jgi:DNA-nicking Smr family endonuclease
MRDVARIKPERPPPKPAEAAEPAPPPARRVAARPAAPKKSTALPALKPGVSPGVDRRTAEKHRRGRLPVEARLDLHGMTQEEAHRALERFLPRAQESGCRSVLIITGKGSRDGTRGVLKEAVPRWLNQSPLRALILSISWAQPKDGGAGALYVLLRRIR